MLYAVFTIYLIQGRFWLLGECSHMYIDIETASHSQTKIAPGTKLNVRSCQPNGVAAADQVE